MQSNSSQEKRSQLTGDAKSFPLSHGQQAMWYLYQIAPQSIPYNIYITVRIGSELDLGAWHRAWLHIVQRHPILRTTYTERDGQPVQVVHPYQEVDVKVTDASSWSEDYLKKQILAEADRPYNLETGPVLRVHLFTRSAEEHIQLLAMHHIAGDMWSFDILLDELRVLYAAQVKTLPQASLQVVENSSVSNSQTDNILPLPTLLYTDYVRWQTEMLASSKGEQLSAYWQKQLAGELPLLDMPLDKLRPSVQAYCGATHIIELDKELLERLRQLSESEKTSLYRILLAAFFVLFYRLSGQEDILVGCPVAGRSGREEFEEIVGYFTDPVVLRANLKGDPTFKDFLAQVRCTVSEAKEHQDYPFSLLVKQLVPGRDPSCPPLFQVSLTWQKHRWYKNAQKSSLLMLPYLIEGHERGAAFDLNLAIIEAGSEFQLCWQYNTDLFDACTVHRMAGSYQTLLEGILTNPEERVSALPLLTQAERHQLLVEWNNTEVEYPFDKCIHQLFEEQVQKTPHSVAVVYEDEQLTYQQLNERANQLAHYLQTFGVGPEVLVGICVERSLNMIVGLLGIFKAGGAYVPLDPAYPFERLGFLLEDSSVPVLLTQSKLVEKLPPHSARVVYLDKGWEEIVQQSKENPSSSVMPDNLAYVIYTSGSTGKPKGVQICHQSVVNFLNFFRLTPGLTQQDIFLAVTTISFDIATLELYLPLIVGAKIVLVTRETAVDGLQLLEKLIEFGATVLQATPATWRLLLASGWQGSRNLKILCGGEALPAELADKLIERCAELWNVYGPTETTIWSTVYNVGANRQGARTKDAPELLGRPIANTKIYILDTENQPVPIGVPGELHIGGVGLARGYLNRPDLTEQKFIPNPFSGEPNSRLYKTGDLARYLPDGNIEFIGRIDNQVKIRGFRIELGEIEAVLSQHPAVLETAIVVQQDADRQYLTACIIPKKSQAISRSDLRGFLFEKLPDYMIPGVFLMLDALPLTPNGKVDRRALHKYAEKMALKESEIELSNLRIDITAQNQQKDTELKITRSDSIGSTLLSLVAKLLHIEVNEVDVSATFLELGMDSLLLLEAMRNIQITFGVHVEAHQFFEEVETIDALATYIEQNMSFEPSQKSSKENDLDAISANPAKLESSKTSPQLAQTKAVNLPIAFSKDKPMNRPNENVEPETNIEKIISQQLQVMSQLMSQQLELLRTEQPHKERSHNEKTTVTEFASPKSFHQSATVTNPSPVCSYNEWDPLEEVIVGIVDGAMVPSWHTIHRATVLPGQEKQMESLSKRTQKQPLPYPEWLVQAASKCVEGFAHILESEGVVVRRPDVVDYSASFRTPDWEVMNGFCAANPRDVFLVIGNEIIEAPMADRSRYFESWAYRSLLKEYLKGGAKWVAAPKPQLLDAQYDPDYKTPAPGEERRFVITEFEPTFDAADFVRFGRDIFVQKSHVTNSLGIEWVRRHLGDEYRVHEVHSLCPQALHIDTTLVPLAPGKVLVNPLFIDVDNLPDYFKSWDILLAPKPNRTPMTLYDTKVISQWVNMNVLSLDEERVIVEKSQEYMIQALKDWGFKPIPCEFESYYPFMGSFHCATLDVRRRGELRSYEMEEGAL